MAVETRPRHWHATGTWRPSQDVTTDTTYHAWASHPSHKSQESFWVYAVVYLTNMTDALIGDIEAAADRRAGRVRRFNDMASFEQWLRSDE